MNYFKVDDIVRIKNEYKNYSNSDYGNSNYRVIVIGGKSMFVQVVSLSTNKQHAFHNSILELDIVYYRKEKLKKLRS
jgi:hypothetical protein